MTTWYYIIGGLITGWIGFTVLAAVSLPKGQIHWDWAAGLIGWLGCLVAGTYATDTWISGLVETIVGISDLTRLLVFGLVLATVALTAAAAVPNRVLGAFTLSLAVGIAWLFVPSALAADVVPGSLGDTITEAVSALTKSLVDNTKWLG